jgi:hypothetical protein
VDTEDVDPTPGEKKMTYTTSVVEKPWIPLSSFGYGTIPGMNIFF